MVESEEEGGGAAPVELVVLRLYVTGGAARSARAIRNVRLFCETHLLGRYDLEVIDLYQQPWLAGELDLVVAPTLRKVSPLPVQRFIGVMANLQRLLESPGVLPGPLPSAQKALG